MAGFISRAGRGDKNNSHDGLTEPRWVQNILIGAGVLFLTLFLLLPLSAVFIEAFRKGAGMYRQAIQDPMTLSALWLTFVTCLSVIPLNILFGLCAAWAITRFRFQGKTFLLTLIDLPFSVSPPMAGMVFVLIFGSRGWLGPWLDRIGLDIIYSTPGIILATWFVTFPFVARELIPLMQAQGNDEELAAYVLGANGAQIFWRVTLPNIKWGLLYGVILCNARAMGEFGAVSVVSGHIRGLTNTVPLHVEILYNEFQFSAAFAVSTLLAGVAIITLLLKTWIEHRRPHEH